MIRLHDFWRSGAAYRVRIALHLKGIAYDIAAHDLRSGEQRAPDYLAVNPQGLVPALDTGTAALSQSLAILEWLDERYPEVPLLPADAEGRAIVRGMAQIICCDIHPLNNLRVLTALRRDLGASEEQVEAWIGRWIGEGFAALEVLIARHGGAYAFGDQPGMVDCCLVPQVYSARRFNVPLDRFPLIVAVTARGEAHPAFAAAEPHRQPGGE